MERSIRETLPAAGRKRKARLSPDFLVIDITYIILYIQYTSDTILPSWLSPSRPDS